MPIVHQAGAHDGGGRGRRRATSTLSEINVVPLVDVMLVLLIIFMVTAPMIQRGIDMNLPTAARAAQVSGERPYVSVPLTYQDDGLVYLNEEAVRADALVERVRQLLETRSEKDAYLQTDAGLHVQDLMDITDRLKEAGVERVAIVARPPTTRR